MGSLPPVTPLSGGSSGYGGGGRTSPPPKRVGFSDQDSMFLKSQPRPQSFFKSFLVALVKFFLTLWTLLRYPFYRTTRDRRRLRLSRLRLISRLRALANRPPSPHLPHTFDPKELFVTPYRPASVREMRKSDLIPSPMEKADTLKKQLLVAMDEVFYDNMLRNLKSKPLLSPENLLLAKRSTPPSILLKNANEEIIVQTISAQIPYTQQRILNLLPEQSQDFVHRAYSHHFRHLRKALSHS